MNDTVIKEEEFIDEDYQEIKSIEEGTDLVTRLKTPLNILLLSLIGIILLAIILVLVFL